MKTLRNQSRHQAFYRDEHLYVDLRHELVTLDGQVLPLTRQEHCLLLLLVQHAGEVVPQATISMQVWGFAPKKRTRKVDLHIERLRGKLGIYADHYIETVPGGGYLFRSMPGP